MEYKIPRGTYDILPEQSWKWEVLTKRFRELAALYGYREIVTPIFEQSELFERSSGASSDVVQKEMYRFTDRKGRNLALRPEGTAPVVRSYVENRYDQKGKIFKAFYSGPMFRYDRPQAGRYRQFYQYGIELIGSNDPYYDAEVIALQDCFLKCLGLSGIRLEINSVGCPNCNQEYDKALKIFFAPHLTDLCPDCQNRYLQKPRRLLDCKVPSCKKIASLAPSQPDYLDEACKAHFTSVQNYLSLMQIAYTVNPRIVRGLDYYSNTAFEFINDDLGAQNSIAGGGRYNGLIEQVGGNPTPAIGFAGGWERLLLSLERAGIQLEEPSATTVFLIAMGERACFTAAGLTNRLRNLGINCAFDPEKSSLKAGLKAASAMGARFAAILGDNELEQNLILLKDLATGTQEQLPLNDINGLYSRLSS